MYPEVQAYVDATEAADKVRDEAYDKANKAYGNHASTRAEYDAANKAARQAYRDAVYPLWEALKTSSDPLVAWIAEHARDEWRRATVVLKACPVDYAELIKIQKANNWCDEEFTPYLDDMIEADVLPGAPAPSTAARKALFAWYRDENGLAGWERIKLTELVDAIVAEAVASPVVTADAV